MAVITIKDLPQSDALDREAMRSVMGGGLSGARPLAGDQTKTGSSGPIVEYPPGCSGQAGKLGGSRTPGAAD